MWAQVLVPAGLSVVRGRYRMEGDQLVLEWRGGRELARCGLVKPEVVATQILRQLISDERRAAA